MIVDFNDPSNFFLNNKYSCSINILGRIFGNAESAYHAHKTLEPQIRDIFSTLDAINSQSIGRNLICYEGWGKDRLKTMLLVIFEKFRQNPDILEKLLATGNQKLVAVSISKESFWGTTENKGENCLGKILMYVREYFKYHSVKELDSISQGWIDSCSIMEAMILPSVEHGILYKSQDITNLNMNFETSIENLNAIKKNLIDYIDFFLIDLKKLNNATEKFVD